MLNLSMSNLVVKKTFKPFYTPTCYHGYYLWKERKHVYNPLYQLLRENQVVS